MDAIGACIGPKGARVNTIVEELGGEKIDVVNYSDDPAAYISAALSPATVLGVEILDADTHSCRVTVPDHQLSLAIGNKGGPPDRLEDRYPSRKRLLRRG